jgi:hypothetical protein
LTDVRGEDKSDERRSREKRKEGEKVRRIALSGLIVGNKNNNSSSRGWNVKSGGHRVIAG